MKYIKKQEFSALDMLISRVRDVVCFTCNLCWNNSPSFFSSMINIFILDVPTLKLRIIIIILSIDRPDTILPTARTTNN